jgi:hypothetical protein
LNKALERQPHEKLPRCNFEATFDPTRASSLSFFNTARFHALDNAGFFVHDAFLNSPSHLRAIREEVEISLL